MNRQEFIRERMKGNPLNQFDMTKDGYHNYLRTQTSILWFVEFPGYLGKFKYFCFKVWKQRQCFLS
jgi:hypothetical protein